MDNVIEFPGGRQGSDEPPLSVAFSATPEQMLEFCVGMLLQVQASITAMTVVLGNDLSVLLMEALKEGVDSKELEESISGARKAALKELYRELQERFPPKHPA